MALKSIKNIFDAEGSKGPLTGNKDLFLHSVQESGVWKSAAVTYDNLYADIYARVKADLEANGWGGDAASPFFTDFDEANAVDVKMESGQQLTLPVDACLLFSYNGDGNWGTSGVLVDEARPGDLSGRMFSGVVQARSSSISQRLYLFVRAGTVLTPNPNESTASVKGRAVFIPLDTGRTDGDLAKEFDVPLRQIKNENITVGGFSSEITASWDSNHRLVLKANPNRAVMMPRIEFRYTGANGLPYRFIAHAKKTTLGGTVTTGLDTDGTVGSNGGLAGLPDQYLDNTAKFYSYNFSVTS